MKKSTRLCNQICEIHFTFLAIFANAKVVSLHRAAHCRIAHYRVAHCRSAHCCTALNLLLVAYGTAWC